MALLNNDKIIYEDAPQEIVPDNVQPVSGEELFAEKSTGEASIYGSGVANIARPYQSSNFRAGVSGWRLNSNGIIQAVGVELSGEITIEGEIVTVPNGGTGASTLTGILKGNGTSAFTAIVPLAGTKVYYVSDSSGGAVTRKLTFNDGVLTAET